MLDLSLPSFRLDGLGRGVPEYGKLGNLGRQHFDASHVPDQSMPSCRSRHLSRPGARHKTSRAHAGSHSGAWPPDVKSGPFHRQQLLYLLPGPTTPTLNGPPDQTDQTHQAQRLASLVERQLGLEQRRPQTGSASRQIRGPVWRPSIYVANPHRASYAQMSTTAVWISRCKALTVLTV